MLMLVAMTHTEDHCPAYHRELFPQLVQVLERREELARTAGVKLHFLVSAAPDHTFYALLEADKQSGVARFCGDILPFPQSCKVTPVESAEELIELSKAMATSR